MNVNSEAEPAEASDISAAESEGERCRRCSVRIPTVRTNPKTNPPTVIGSAHVAAPVQETAVTRHRRDGCHAVVAGCSSSTKPAPSSTTPTPPPMATPLVGSVIASPIPVPATDGRTHLAYELMLTNFSNGDATLNSLTALAGDKKLLTLSGDNLKYWTRVAGSTTTPANVIGSGQSAIVWLDVIVDNGAQVPTDITHSVALTVAKPIPPLVPPNVTETVAPVTVQTRKPVSISPPLEMAELAGRQQLLRYERAPDGGQRDQR